MVLWKKFGKILKVMKVIKLVIYGRIRTHNKITYTKKHGYRYWKDRILKPKISKKDKCTRVELWANGKHKTFLLYRLVANAFLEKNINTKMTVNHKDGNRLNNRLDNLEWLSQADNIRYGFTHGQYNCCKKCTLIKSNEKYEFYSMSEADRFLGRKCGYISAKKQKKQNIAISKSGEKYKILF